MLQCLSLDNVMLAARHWWKRSPNSSRWSLYLVYRSKNQASHCAARLSRSLICRNISEQWATKGPCQSFTQCECSQMRCEGLPPTHGTQHRWKSNMDPAVRITSVQAQWWKPAIVQILWWNARVNLFKNTVILLFLIGWFTHRHS